MSRIHVFIGSLLVSASSLLILPVASASIIGLPDFQVTLASTGSSAETLSGQDLGIVETSDGTYTSTGMHTDPSGGAEYNWALLLDPDPTIGGTFGFTNLLDTARDYTLTLTLPIGAAFSGAVVNGHFGGSIEDMNGSGNAYLNDIVWSGLIDGHTVMNAGPGDIACAGAGCSTLEPTTYLGPLTYLPEVSDTIATHIGFTLSAGDQVTFSTYFDVAPIPEPGTFALLAGLLSLPLAWQITKAKRAIRPTEASPSRTD